MRATRVRRCTAALAALSVLVAACGSGTNERPTTTSSPTTVAPSSTSSAASTTTDGGGEAAGVDGDEVNCPPVPARAQPDPSRPVHRLSVHVDPDAKRVTGTLSSSMTFDQATDRIVYRLWPNGPRPARGGAVLSVDAVRIGGQNTAFAQPEVTRVDVPVAGGIRPGQRLELGVDFTLALPGAIDDRVASGDGWVRLGSFFPTLEWVPGRGWNTEPPTSGFAEASVSATADWTLTVTTAPGYDVVASGVEGPAGTFTADAARDVAVAVGHFKTWTAVAHAPDPVEVTVAVQAGTSLDGGAFADKIVRMLELFAQRYGPYPWPRYTLSLTPSLGGGIEYPMHVMQGPGTFGRTTTHEVAHMWFYGLVGDHQGLDPWLDEGLATWAEGVGEATTATLMGRTIPTVGQGRLGEPMSFWERRQSAYYRSVYVQGAQAIGALGPPALVDCVLAHLVAVEAHRVATPADLVGIAERLRPGATEVLARFGIHG